MLWQIATAHTYKTSISLKSLAPCSTNYKATQYNQKGFAQLTNCSISKKAQVFVLIISVIEVFS